MKLKLIAGMAALVAGLTCASSASAALVYFDAQIVDVPQPKGPAIPKNTVMCDPLNGCAETAFTAMPHDPVNNPAGNWTQNGANPIPPGTGTGSDNAWNQRFATPAPGNFGNPDATGNGTVYESRGQFGGPNTEDPAVLKTTVNVPLVDQGTLKGVYALFWTDQSNWQVAACLECVIDEGMPVFQGNFQQLVPSTYVFGVYDVGAGDPGNLSNFDLEMNGYTTSDAMPTGTGGTNRRLKAAFLGNVTLGTTLSVFVGDGPAFADPGANSQNARTWYDGIAYGDVQNLEPLACIPEPTSFVLLGLGVAGFALRRRG
jgi:hypothetical protein